MATASLDHRTQLVIPGQGWCPRLAPYVLATFYPDAGEAVVCQAFPGPAEAPERPPRHDGVTMDAENWERANRRARGRSRRYIVSNRLRFMWVLTFEGTGLHGPAGRVECMAAVADLMRKLRAAAGPLPYWYSPELHPDGHGWHCNLFVPRWLKHSLVRDLWGRGHVWVKDWAADSRVAGRPFIEQLRAGASYGAKYAAKDWDAVHLAGGAHRYERAEGFEPRQVVAEVRSVEDGVALALAYLGGPGRVWRSSDDPEWSGPSCAVVFAGRPARSP